MTAMMAMIATMAPMARVWALFLPAPLQCWASSSSSSDSCFTTPSGCWRYSSLMLWCCGMVQLWALITIASRRGWTFDGGELRR